MLRVVGFSPKPRIAGEMAMYPASVENPWLSVAVRADISRRRWYGEIEPVKACRVTIRVRRADNGQRRILAGGWIGNDARSFLSERTLSEGGMYMIPIARVVEGRVYVSDGVFMGKFLHLAHAMSDGEHWMTIELWSGSRQTLAIGVLRRRIQKRLQMLVDQAVEQAVLGGAGLIAGKTVGHVDDVDATSRRRQCREVDTRHPWGWDGVGRRPGGCLFRGTAPARGLALLDHAVLVAERDGGGVFRAAAERIV